MHANIHIDVCIPLYICFCICAYMSIYIYLHIGHVVRSVCTEVHPHIASVSRARSLPGPLHLRWVRAQGLYVLLLGLAADGPLLPFNEAIRLYIQIHIYLYMYMQVYVYLYSLCVHI